jgi:hypothetical protein
MLLVSFGIFRARWQGVYGGTVKLVGAVGDRSGADAAKAVICADGVDPWLNEDNILPGQDWDREVKKAVGENDAVIVCLSRRSLTKEGYVRKEIKIALDVADEKPEGTIFLIPVKLEECDVPDRLRRWQWVSLFEERGYEKLLRALRAGASTLGIETPNHQIVKTDPVERSMSLVVQSVAYSTDFNGIAVVADLENPAPTSDQVTAWELELPTLEITLHGGPGRNTLLDQSRVHALQRTQWR